MGHTGLCVKRGYSITVVFLAFDVELPPVPEDHHLYAIGTYVGSDNRGD